MHLFGFLLRNVVNALRWLCHTIELEFNEDRSTSKRANEREDYIINIDLDMPKGKRIRAVQKLIFRFLHRFCFATIAGRLSACHCFYSHILCAPLHNICLFLLFCLQFFFVFIFGKQK